MSTPPKVIRAALYARYSSDKQSPTSIDDQLRAARVLATSHGWEVVGVHHDAETTGSVPPSLRPGSKRLIADALARRFDVLIVEALDRIVRNLGEQELLVNRFEYHGIRIIGTSDGYDTEQRGRKVTRVFRGLQNEIYLDDLREKTHRGLAGKFDRGFHVGGLTFGYRSNPSPDGKGHFLSIDETQAEIVRWAFSHFAEGHSTRSIVRELNARGVQSARGGTWAISAVQGSAEKGLGLLHNELYLGRQVWNRRQTIKNPETGRRSYVERPRDEWMTREVPGLRIISDELWHAVQTRERRGPARGTRSGSGAVPRTLFGGGILRCYACGAAVVAINRERYGCSARKDRGPTVCPSGHTVKRDLLDTRLVSELRDELLTDDSLSQLRSEVANILSAVAREAGAGSANARRRLVDLDAEIGRIVNAVAVVGISPALQAKLQTAEAERAQLSETVKALPEVGTVPSVDDLVSGYKTMVTQLRTALDSNDDRDRTRTILADLLGTVIVARDDQTGKSHLEMERPAERLLMAASGGSLKVVAGARFELATFGL